MTLLLGFPSESYLRSGALLPRCAHFEIRIQKKGTMDFTDDTDKNFSYPCHPWGHPFFRQVYPCNPLTPWFLTLASSLKMLAAIQQNDG
jgi:hypothetical protein